MITKFEGVPRPFIDMYRPELEHWARDFRRRGSLQRIELKFPPTTVLHLNPDPAQGRVRHFVTLMALHQRNRETGEQRMVVKPHTDEDAEKIERHTREVCGRIFLQ